MTVVLLVEGATETALKGHLKRFLDQRADQEGRPKLALRTKSFRSIPTESQFRKRLRLELQDGRVQAVIGLLDVYPKFASAREAKNFMRRAADHDKRFHAHAAQYDVEAWLIPYWESICRRIGVNRAPPGAEPERINLQSPPSKRLAELYQTAKRKYKKPVEMNAILEGQDLLVAARACGELREVLNTLLHLAGLREI